MQLPDGPSFSNVPSVNDDVRLRRLVDDLQQNSRKAKYGLITEVATDHIKAEIHGTGERVRVYLPITWRDPALVIPPYVVGGPITVEQMETPPVAVNPYADITTGRRLHVDVFRMRAALVVGGLSISANFRSCSISLPLSDTFTDTNGVTLANHIMDAGCGWTVLSGSIANLSIQSNAVRHDGTATDLVQCVTDDITHHVAASFVVGTAATEITCRVLNRIQNSSNYWFALARVQPVSANSSIEIREVSGGVTTLRATKTTTIAFGDSITLTFRDGDTAPDDLNLYMTGARTDSVGPYNSTLLNTQKNVGFGASAFGTITSKTTIDDFSCVN